MIELVQQFILALFATLGFAIIFRVPIRHFPACCCIGAAGWISYIVAVHYFDSPAIGCFAGACVVGLLSTWASRLFKDASTIFVIPGILCLVPGSKIFLTMQYLLAKDMDASVDAGFQVLMMAGAIALGLLVVGAVLGVLNSIRKRAGTIKIRLKDLR